VIAYLMAAWQLHVKSPHCNRVSKLLAYLVAGHSAGLIGTLRYLLRLDKGHWKKIN